MKNSIYFLIFMTSFQSLGNASAPVSVSKKCQATFNSEQPMISMKSIYENKYIKEKDENILIILGQMHLLGIGGTHQDYGKALSFLEEPAFQGNRIAQYRLSLLLEEYPDLFINSSSSFLHWLTESANKNYPLALLRLGEKYLYGDNVFKNEAAGFKWILKAAIRQNLEASKLMVFLYENGVGIEKNIPRSLVWRQRVEEIESKSDLITKPIPIRTIFKKAERERKRKEKEKRKGKEKTI